MQRSTERILTTHTGSLPRPPGVALPGTAEALSGSAADEDEIRGAVAATVGRQREAGVDVINDGEVSKPSYATYITTRLTGFEGTSVNTWTPPEATDFPEYFARVGGDMQEATTNPACNGPVTYRDRDALARDIANLRAASAGSGASDVFMTSASPGVISLFMANQYYPSHEDYISALADAMKEEYDAIAAAGFILQIDCPDLAAGWQMVEADGTTLAEYRVTCAQHIEAINHATRDIAPESMRMHVCWGNYEGPHNHDVALSEIIDVVFRARPSGLLFEAANPRHAHEWVVFEDVAVPDGKVLIPGVLDSTDNYIEHPELIAQRIERLAAIVGKENVMAGSDCGFATFAQVMPVDPRVTWAKLASMAEGARLASSRLWAQ